MVHVGVFSDVGVEIHGGDNLAWIGQRLFSDDSYIQV